MRRRPGPDPHRHRRGRGPPAPGDHVAGSATRRRRLRVAAADGVAGPGGPRRGRPGPLARPELGCPRPVALGRGGDVGPGPRDTAEPQPTSRRSASVPSQVPEPLAFGTPLGLLRAEVVAQLGLRARIPVVAGVNDGTASMLGAGLVAPGDAVDTGGASGGLAVLADRAISLPGLYSAPGAAAGAMGGGRRHGGPRVRPSTGCGRRCSGIRSTPRPCSRRRRWSSPARAGSCSCRTWRANGRRCSTRRHGARSSG